MLLTGMNSKVDRGVVAGASHLNNKTGPWWKDRGLRTLNFLIFIPLMSEYVQGYDASLINNVQQLASWQKGVQEQTEDLNFSTNNFLRVPSSNRVSSRNIEC